MIHFYSNKNIFVYDFHTNSPKILPLDPTRGPSPTFYLQPSMSLATLNISKTAKELHRAKEGAVKCILKTQP